MTIHQAREAIKFICEEHGIDPSDHASILAFLVRTPWRYSEEQTVFMEALAPLEDLAK